MICNRNVWAVDKWCWFSVSGMVIGYAKSVACGRVYAITWLKEVILREPTVWWKNQVPMSFLDWDMKASRSAFNNWHCTLSHTKKDKMQLKIKYHGRCKRLGWLGFGPTTFLQTKRALAHFEYMWSSRCWPRIKAAACHCTYKFLLMLRQDFQFTQWLSLTATKPVLPVAAWLANSFTPGS